MNQPSATNNSGGARGLLWVCIAVSIVAIALFIVVIVLLLVYWSKPCDNNGDTVIVRRRPLFSSLGKLFKQPAQASSAAAPKIELRPIANNVNLPTVISSAVFPGGNNQEQVVICTEVGEVLVTDGIGGAITTLLDLRNYQGQSLILNPLGNATWPTENSESVQSLLGAGYDERGLLGIAFHPDFRNNGRFWLWYTGSDAPVKFPPALLPDACRPETLHQQWQDPQTLYDHIQVLDEWKASSFSQAERVKTLLNVRWPFLNHDSNSALVWSPETNKLIASLGDGGFEYDPFNLSQDDSFLHGKILELDVDSGAWNSFDSQKSVAKFDELGSLVSSGAVKAVAKGVRNPVGLVFQPDPERAGQWIKYMATAGQNAVEPIFAFRSWTDQNGEIINFGWRAYEGAWPTTTPRRCEDFKITLAHASIRELSYPDEAVALAVPRHGPVVQYYHQDRRPDKTSGTVVTGLAVYRGNNKSAPLYNKLVWADALQHDSDSGWIGTATVTGDPTLPLTSLHDFQVAQLAQKPTDYRSINYYTTMGSSADSSRVFVGVYGSFSPLQQHDGTVYEVVGT